MTDLSAEALMALLLSGIAVFLWSVLVGRCFVRRQWRLVNLVMYIVGLLASVGSFASAWGFAMSLDGLSSFPDLDPIVVTMVASIGRGALLMGGLILLILGRPIRMDDN